MVYHRPRRGFDLGIAVALATVLALGSTVAHQPPRVSPPEATAGTLAVSGGDVAPALPLGVGAVIVAAAGALLTTRRHPA